MHAVIKELIPIMSSRCGLSFGSDALRTGLHPQAGVELSHSGVRSMVASLRIWSTNPFMKLARFLYDCHLPSTIERAFVSDDYGDLFNCSIDRELIRLTSQTFDRVSSPLTGRTRSWTQLAGVEIYQIHRASAFQSG